MRKLLRSPVLVIPATAGGAFIGWWVWPVAVYIVMDVLRVMYQGFPAILDRFLSWEGAVLGGLTAFALVMSASSWRVFSGRLLIVVALGGIIWVAPHAWDFVRSDGRRMALAVYGLAILWSCLLITWGYRMQRREFCKS